MSRLTLKLPSYRLHKPSGRAVVTLDGRDHYLGVHGSTESRNEYDRVIGEYLANGRRQSNQGGSDPSGSTDPSINEVLLAFWRHAERHYGNHQGKTSSELGNFRDTFRPLKKLWLMREEWWEFRSK